MKLRPLLVVLCALAFAPAARAAVPPPPGGPILVITSNDGFGQEVAEILRAEGLNEFSVTDTSQLSSQTLARAAVAILGPGSVSDAQAAALSAWVQAGGRLVAMRPDPKLAPLLGLSGPGGALANGYIGIDTSRPPGAGITAATMQFHGTADLYALAGARAVATLYSDASAPTANPAVTVRDIGSAGGRAAAFTYDLGRSIVYTRQGNPAWAGQERDNAIDQNSTTIRSDDLFFGQAPGDLQPDWVNLGKVAIPQADEQQRLLANLVTDMSADRLPLPRFWYLPKGKRAALVLTSDDHQGAHIGNTTADRFEGLYQRSIDRDPRCEDGAPGHDAAVDDWDCILATSYVYPVKDFSTSERSAQANRDRYVAAGFEIALHVRIDPTNANQCVNFTSTANLEGYLNTQLAQFASAQGGVPAPVTIRTHCVVWADWASQPIADQAAGIGLNTDYYYWPKSWTQLRNGMFTGSGIPMRFADVDGSLFDVFQATTQVPDETYIDGLGFVDPDAINAAVSGLFDNALGPLGYYGAFTVNLHADGDTLDVEAQNDIVDAALARGIPVISARQLLQWMHARESSAFRSLSFDGTTLRFAIDPSPSAHGLQAMVPARDGGGSITGLTRDGAPVATTTQTIKGVAYLVFDAAAGSYSATYAPDPAAPPASAPPGSPRRPTAHQVVEVLRGATNVRTFPRLVQSGATLRPGAGRALTLTFRLPHAAKITWTIRSAKGKVVRRIRTRAYAKGTVLRLRWDGRDSRGHVVAPGRYRFTVTASAHRYSRTARGSVKVLAAR